MAITGFAVTLHVYNGFNPIDMPHAFVSISAPGQPKVTVGYYPVVTTQVRHFTHLSH